MEDADASVAAAGEYRKMLHRLMADDPPRFEDAFKSLLNENTIREVANFQSQLNRERETIRERMETIDQSMHGINYNPGRYIQLEANPNPTRRSGISSRIYARARSAHWWLPSRKLTRKRSFSR